MYELEKVNQDIIDEYSKCIYLEIEKKDKSNLINAIKYAIEKNSTEDLIQLTNAKVKQASIILERIFNRKIEKFNSEDEAKSFFEKIHAKELDYASKNPNDLYSEIIWMAYDLCKYDTKITYKGKSGFYNISYLILTHKKHYRAYRKWIKEFENKPAEMNINISHNTNKGLNDQLKFLESSYNHYKANTYAKDITRDAELNLIESFKEDRHMIARSLTEMTNVHYYIEDERLKQVIQGAKNLKPFLNSDKPIDKTDIINSWLTNIAYLYTHINPQGIPKTKLSSFIQKIASSTTIYDNKTVKKLFSPEKLRKATYREIKSYKNLRIMEITDNRKKIDYNNDTVKETEEYLLNIINYLKKINYK